MPKIKGIISLVLRIVVTVVLVVLLFEFQQIDLKRLLGNMRSADKGLLFLAFLVSLLMYLLCLVRWNILLKIYKLDLSFKRVVTSFAGGVFFSSLLPSTIGGDLVRSTDLAAHTKKAKEIVATVFLDRLSGCVGLLTVALFASPFAWKLVEDKNVLFVLVIITGLLLVVLLAIFNEFLFSKINNLLHRPEGGKIMRAIKELHEEIHYFKEHKKILFLTLFLSILVQISSQVAFYITGLALGLKIHLVYFFIFIPLVGAITLLPIAIGGLGIRENATVFFFSKVGVAKEPACAMSFINSIFILIFAVIGGIIYVLTVHHRRLQPVKPPCLS